MCIKKKLKLIKRYGLYGGLRLLKDIFLTKFLFCSIFYLPTKPPSLTGLLKISRPDRSRSAGGTRRNARRISGPDIKTAAFGKASPKSMEMG